MFCQKNFLIDVELTLVSGFASIHFVKYSCYYRESVIALRWGQLSDNVHALISVRAMVHMWILASLHQQSLSGNKNVAARFWRLMLWLQYDLSTLLHGPPSIFVDL
jgi:hypothetical protein